MDPSTSSNFYFERVGFEAKVNCRRNLKVGSNMIGRNDTPGVDIGINSLLCSRNHCIVNVSDDEVSVEDLNSSNGTTVNRVQIKAKKVILKEHDLIGIIGGGNPLSVLSGNHNFVVYRLCKYSSNNIQTFEIEDEDPIELSDDEDNIICLDSDGESVDIKEEYELDIQLSRSFNIEIKKELEDLDDYEAISIKMKKEPDDSQPNEMDKNMNEWVEYFNPPEENLNEEVETTGEESSLNVDSVFNQNDNSNDYTEKVSSMDVDPVNNENDNSNDSIDSNQTVCFPTIQEQKSVNDLPNSDGASSLSDLTNIVSNKLETKVLSLKLKEAVEKVIDSEERKRRKLPEMIYAKPLNKRRKSKGDESPPQNDKPTQKSTTDRKEKLKAVASTSPKRIVPDEEKRTTSTHTTPKVKFTPNNRGSFLADLAQLPALPREIQRKHKVKEDASKEVASSPKKVKSSPEKVLLGTEPTPPELEIKILENMCSHVTNQDSTRPLSDRNTKSIGILNPYLEAHAMENEDSGTESFSQDDDEDTNDVPDIYDDGVEMDTTENEANEERDENDDDDEDILYNILMQLPPETGKIHIIETVPKPAEIKSILKSPATTNISITKRKVTFKETGFQYDPRHKIISDLTAYDCTKFDTVDAFCRCVDTNIRSFADSYEDYEEYRETLVSLMMVELWKEIELEYVNSKIHCFTTVTINYQSPEKRGDCRRMIFHCQADSLYKSQSISDGHLVFVKCQHIDRDIEFVALITSMAYSNKEANEKLAHFTMETSALTEITPMKLLQIRPITVITNTLNSFNAIYNLKRSPLKNLVINPLSEPNLTQPTRENLTYKTCDPLDETQRGILNSLYRRCINLNVPNISLLDGAAGTGKTRLMVNLALQLVYGDGLPRPLRILICSKSNGNINEITRKLIQIRDNTRVNTKIQLVRFGQIENMDPIVRRVSVQHLKEIEMNSLQYSSYEDLVNQRDTLQLKVTALSLDNESDHSRNLNVLQKQLFKVNSLMDRFQGLETKRIRDTATFILNSCDIICTTLASIPKLQSYVSEVDVCIIDEATQCSEPLTLLPLQFGVPSLVLVGDSQLVPVGTYSRPVKELNFGNSMFARWQKLFLGKFGSPIFEMNFQYRVHEELLLWTNRQFYKNRLVPHINVKDDNFSIVPYKVISYNPDGGMMESTCIMMVVKVLLGHVDRKTQSVGMICTNFKQNSILKNKLRDYPYISTNTAETYMGEKDVIIIWISKEHGIGNLAHQQILNLAVTRPRKSLIICGANLICHRNWPIWKSLLDDAHARKCLQHFNMLSAPKICNTLSKNILKHERNTCTLCANVN